MGTCRKFCGRGGANPPPPHGEKSPPHREKCPSKEKMAPHTEKGLHNNKKT